jgi:aminoglycoside phosphotransferase (APT) family kinase protein
MQAFTGTRPVAAEHAFDVEALQRWLGERLPELREPLKVEQFKGGQSNPTYKLTAPGGSYVMRAKPGPTAQLLPSAHAIEREFRVLKALASTDVPVARVHLLCEDESVIGRAFYLMDFVDGRVLWDPLLGAQPRAERARVYDEMNRVIAALHNVDVQAAGLADYGRSGNYFERQTARWSKQYRASATTPIPEMDNLMDWLPQHLPASASDDAHPCIVHGDFRLDNVIFHRSEPRALVVLDWELSTLGHPLADFSYHCLAWATPQGQGRGIGGVDLQAAGIPSQAEYLRLYCERTGRHDVQAVSADWNYFLAFNLFRLAAILQGVTRRALDGVAASAVAREQGAQARVYAELAWRFARLHRH